jgi:hypothetical protein
MSGFDFRIEWWMKSRKVALLNTPSVEHFRDIFQFCGSV